MVKAPKSAALEEELVSVVVPSKVRVPLPLVKVALPVLDQSPAKFIFLLLALKVPAELRKVPFTSKASCSCSVPEPEWVRLLNDSPAEVSC